MPKLRGYRMKRHKLAFSHFRMAQGCSAKYKIRMAEGCSAKYKSQLYLKDCLPRLLFMSCWKPLPSPKVQPTHSTAVTQHEVQL